ncbi:very short patch repair endonuclease [Clavibacter michiganensis subsp. phaseoli]|uniref:Very short patch repair endonuclease n=1 Tax=Clavibacter phaseoli TaxID=1734031 RepID=A0A8I0SBZ8_9MICO|nr:very short patch repair endonuclease [Clavibacter phaseoli]MBF4632021.1 very short patch repair endonuclease [Clavibacter phaseoli]
MSWASSASARSVMRANKRRDTRPEILVRRLLHARGLRYRVDHRVVPESRSRADIAFTRQRIAVFIDGCFWHSCPEHLHLPKANADYWTPKLARNVERDAEVTAVLRGLGWTVLRFWEHEPAREVADLIIAAVQRARSSASTARGPHEAGPVDGSQ